MLELLKEIFLYAKEHKKMFLLPLIVILLLLGSLIFFTQGSVVAPFIYTLF